MNESRICENRTLSLTSLMSTTTKLSLSLPTIIFSQFGRETVRRSRRLLPYQCLSGNFPYGWFPCFRRLLGSCKVVVVRLELFLAAVGTDLVHCACHGVIGDGVVPHHAKGVGVRMRAYHFVMLVNYDGCQRQYGQQRVGRIIQCIIIGIMLVTIAMCQITPPRAYRFNHVSFLHTLTFPDEWPSLDFRERRVNALVNIGGTTRAVANMPIL